MVEKKDLLLSFDIGTTTLKVGLFTVDGSLLTMATREQKLEQLSRGRVVQSPRATWVLLGEAVEEILKNFPAKNITAISLSIQRGTVVPLDSKGNPLIDQIVWMDRRGIPYTDWLRDCIGEEEYYQIAGHSISHVTGISKILWTQKDAEDIWSITEVISPPQTVFLKWLGCDDFICDLSLGTYLFPFNIEKKTWSTRLADKINFPIEKLPKLVTAIEVVGSLSQEAAKYFNLRPGISLVAGGGDGQCAAAGSGVLKPGLCMVNIGTATGVQVYLPEVNRDPNLILNCSGHVDPNGWEMEGHTQASGSVLRWFRDEFGYIEKACGERIDQKAYDILVDQAKSAPLGSEKLIFLPTFMGSTAPEPNADAKGVLAGLTLSHTRNHVIRSLLEGISLEIRWMLDAIINTGVEVNEIMLVGGGSKNKYWNQIHADVIGRPVRVVAINDAALVGAAMCAAVGLGYYDDLEEASHNFVKVKKTIDPVRKNVSIYNNVYERFRDLFITLHNHYY